MNLAFEILPPAQRAFWAEMQCIPDHFVLYGGTALALRLGHRQSIDFDFFSSSPVDLEELNLPCLRDAEVLQQGPNTATVRVDRGGPVIISFFGNLSFGQLQQPAGEGERMELSLRMSAATSLRDV